MLNEKNRSTLMGVVGAYLIYLAYGLFRDRADANTTMSPAMRILFIALFVLVGIALLIYAVLLWRRAAEEEKQHSDEDEHTMK